jgi:hypothetical protein
MGFFSWCAVDWEITSSSTIVKSWGMDVTYGELDQPARAAARRGERADFRRPGELRPAAAQAVAEEAAAVR